MKYDKVRPFAKQAYKGFIELAEWLLWHDFTITPDITVKWSKWDTKLKGLWFEYLQSCL